MTTPQGVPIVEDNDMESTDLMKCVCALQEREKTQVEVFPIPSVQLF
jgi:hypothetical protein